MSSLAVKYRPTTFDECVGQETVVKILTRQLEQKTFSNCYLFSGASGCVDKDTEFFAGTGWKKISEYQYGDKVLQYNPDTNSGELICPIAYIKEPCETFNHFHTKYGVDMMLSDEHTMVYMVKNKLYTKSCEKIVQQHRANKFGFQGKFLTTFNFSGGGIPLTDFEIMLMCAVICDGTFNKAQPTSNRCHINLKKQSKINKLSKLLTDMNLEFDITYKKNGYTLFKFYAPIRAKEFDSSWYNCTQDQLRIICDTILDWDGNGYNRFSQRNKNTVDFIQFAFSACGYRASIYTQKRKPRVLVQGEKQYAYDNEVDYSVNICRTHSSTVGLGSSVIDSVPSTDGYKYCFTVPTHMWIMRRNGNICITGNCGKTSSARVLANAINQGCGHPIEIDAASNSGVDNVRQIISEASQRSLDSEYKIYIVDEVQVLSAAAWQAFLKCIEEPPKYTIFIFCTTDPQKIPPTIINRCMRFNFGRISPDLIENRLAYICQQEGFTNYSDSINYISKISKGQMRDAIANLEKVAAYDTNLSLESTTSILGNYSYKLMFELINGLIDGKDSTVFTVLNNLFESGSDLKIFVDQFLTFTLDLMNYSIFKNCKIIQIPSMLENELITATNFDAADKYYSYVVDKLLELKNMLKTDVNPNNTCEVMLLQISRCK